MFFSKMKARTLWIITAALFLISIGLVVGVIYSNGTLRNVLVGAIAISFLALTISIQAATFKSFKPKYKKRNCPEAMFSAKYDELGDALKANKFKLRKKSYGDSYLFIQNKVAYKVTLVNNILDYFDTEAQSQVDDTDLETKRRLDNCKKFIGLEIFKENNEEFIERLKDFTLRGSRVYYTAFVKIDDNVLKCYNYEEPDENFMTEFMELLNSLNINRIHEIETKENIEENIKS